jgi:hypothetical protein
MGLGTVSSQHFYGSPIELTWGGGMHDRMIISQSLAAISKQGQAGSVSALDRTPADPCQIYEIQVLLPPPHTHTHTHGIELFPRYTLEHAELAAEVVITCTVCMQGLSLFCTSIKWTSYTCSKKQQMDWVVTVQVAAIRVS